jgi:hypothetical protein
MRLSRAPRRREGTTQWVTRNRAQFASRSIPLRVEFLEATVTSDAGLLLPRELDERLGLSALIEGRPHRSSHRTRLSVLLARSLSPVYI